MLSGDVRNRSVISADDPATDSSHCETSSPVDSRSIVMLSGDVRNRSVISADDPATDSSHFETSVDSRSLLHASVGMEAVKVSA